MKTLIVSPTYNECDNILDLIGQIWDVNPEYHILIIDDNSPDGTADFVKQQMKDHDNLFIIERPGKLGLGTAYCTGFAWALEKGYDIIIEMDADLSHNPQDLPRMVEALSDADVVIGSRYINGVNVVNWPMRRLILSYMANRYAKYVIGLPVLDATAGFKCFKKEVLEAIDLKSIKSEGYSFQIEMNFNTWIKGFKIKEIPIVFTDRTVGKSKMTRKIIYEAAWMVIKLRLKKMFGRI